MKTPKILMAALMVACVTSSAFARLGETEAQCEQRYGKPAQSTNVGAIKNSVYHFRSFQIIVSFEDGKSKSEAYAKEDSAEISNGEITALLDANSGGAPWIEKESGLDKVYAGAGDLFASYNWSRHYLMITTKGFMDRTTTTLEGEAKKKLSGF
jgi:hypothetical protein